MQYKGISIQYNKSSRRIFRILQRIKYKNIISWEMYKLTDLKEKLEDLTRMIVINQKQLPESTECNTENYQWNSQEYQTQAKKHFDNIIMAKELGLNAQIDLNAKAIFELMLKDYTKRTCETYKIKIKNLKVRPVAYQHNEYWVDGDIFSKHKLSTKNMLLPKESLQVLAKLQELPKGFVQEVAAFKLRERKDSILAVRIFDNWYSIKDAKEDWEDTR